MSEEKDKLAILNKELETSMYGKELIWKKGEIVWIGGEDTILGMVTICKFDKPFATYISREWVDEFVIVWKEIK